MSQISHYRFFNNLKSTEVMLDKYWTRLLVCLKGMKSSRLFSTMDLVSNVDYSLPQGNVLSFL